MFPVHLLRRPPPALGVNRHIQPAAAVRRCRHCHRCRNRQRNGIVAVLHPAAAIPGFRLVAFGIDMKIDAESPRRRRLKIQLPWRARRHWSGQIVPVQVNFPRLVGRKTDVDRIPLLHHQILPRQIAGAVGDVHFDGRYAGDARRRFRFRPRSRRAGLNGRRRTARPQQQRQQRQRRHPQRGRQPAAHSMHRLHRKNPPPDRSCSPQPAANSPHRTNHGRTGCRKISETGFMPPAGDAAATR